MNKITITLDGKEYQIDIQKAKELGLLKEQDTRCKSWKDFRNKYKSAKGFNYDEFNEEMIIAAHNPCATYEQLTEEEAIAISAFSKLLKLRRDWIDNWNPDWSNVTVRKYYIYFRPNKFFVDFHCDYSRAFTFPTKEMAMEFLDCFKDLFEQCKHLI